MKITSSLRPFSWPTRHCTHCSWCLRSTSSFFEL